MDDRRHNSEWLLKLNLASRGTKNGEVRQPAAMHCLLNVVATQDPYKQNKKVTWLASKEHNN